MIMNILTKRNTKIFLPPIIRDKTHPRQNHFFGEKLTKSFINDSLRLQVQIICLQMNQLNQST